MNHKMKTIKTKEEIKIKIKELAKQINQDYKEKYTVLIVLKGAFVFASDLVRELTGNFEIEFIRLSSYLGTKSSGEIKKDYSSLEKFAGKNILVVEDIIDTGLSMTELKEDLEKANAKVKICSLLKRKNQNKIKTDYCGFTLGKEFVIGYGLDYNEKFRNLPYLADYQEEK